MQPDVRQSFCCIHAESAANSGHGGTRSSLAKRVEELSRRLSHQDDELATLRTKLASETARADSASREASAAAKELGSVISRLQNKLENKMGENKKKQRVLSARTSQLDTYKASSVLTASQLLRSRRYFTATLASHRGSLKHLQDASMALTL